MKPNTGNKGKLFFLAIMLALVTPSASAYGRTGISPLDKAIELISNLFNIQVLKNNTIVQEGFLKFMIFITLFAISHAVFKMAFKKLENGNRVAGIISFAFSMIGVFLMPTDWLFATGAIITAVMSSLIFVIVFIGGAWVAIKFLRGDWFKNLLGFMLLLLLIFMLDYWAEFTHLPRGGTMMPLFLLVNHAWLARRLKR